MKRILATGLLVVLSLGGAAAQQSGTTGGANADAVVKAVTDMEHRWIRFHKASDGDALGGILSNDFVGLDADGTVRTKAQVVARTKKSKWVTSEVADIKVAVHGDTAIASGSWVGKGTDDAGQAVDAKERWIDTWMKMADGKWLCVASSSAPSK
jgi:ketosteroid isomerase-like protein